MDAGELAPGLWRWTARHPEWKPDDGGPEGWDEVVSSYALTPPDVLVLFDPLVPAEAEHRGRFWKALDRDVAAHGAPHVLLTVYWHARSAQAILDRYDGARVWSHERTAADARERTTVTDTFSTGDALPAGVTALESVRGGELLFWLPDHRAVVAGDLLLGTPAGGVRVCPDAWLEGRATPDALRDELRSLLDRPLRAILPTHGAPVTDDARTALDVALDG